MKLGWTFVQILGSAVLLTTIASCVLLEPTDPYRPLHLRAGPVASTRLRGRVPTSQPVLPSPLTLDKCLALAQQNNPDVGQAGWNVATAAAARQIAAGERWPELRAVGGYTYSLDNQRFIQPRSATDPAIFGRHVFSGDLVLRMPLFTGGRITSEIQAAQLLTKAAEHRLARTREELVFNVSSVFYSILAQRRVIAAIDFSVKALEEHRKRISDLIAVQKAAPTGGGRRLVTPNWRRKTTSPPPTRKRQPTRSTSLPAGCGRPSRNQTRSGI